MQRGRHFMTKILSVDSKSITFDAKGVAHFADIETKHSLEEAAALLNDSQVVAFPTETVYGLGASSLSTEAVKRIYAAKNRPADNPLITHVSSVEMIKDILKTNVPDIYNPLIEKFWPGPLTIILPIPKDSPLSSLVTAGQDTFAVRLPEHPIARALISISNLPLAAPSANASTKPSPTLASHVNFDLQGKIPLILDGGACNVGLESTVVDGTVNPPMLLRPGGISLEKIQNIGGEWTNIVLGKKTAGQYEKVKTPGMKYKHYSPSAKVIVYENSNNGTREILKYLQTNKNGGKIAILKTKNWEIEQFKNNSNIIIIDLGKTGDDIQRNLFAALRYADSIGVETILVEGVGEEMEGLAIMNRLTKAASKIIDCNI